MTSKKEQNIIYYNTQADKGLYADRFEIYKRFLALSTADIIGDIRTHFDGDSPLTILDLGCGDCTRYNMINEARQESDFYKGIDISESMAREALNNGHYAEVGDITHMPGEPSGHYDVELCLLGVFNLMLKKEEQNKALQNIHRTLTPEGRLYMDVFLTPEEPDGPWPIDTGDDTEGWAIGYTRDSICDKLENQGFNIVMEKQYDTNFKGITSQGYTEIQDRHLLLAAGLK